MLASPAISPSVKTTSYKVVLPFYVYAAVSFLCASVFLLTSSDAFLVHYFHPHILALTHVMALGWATMIILGASHQLVPVLVEGKLYSDKLAYLSFFLGAVGIPMLVYGFYTFNMSAPAKWGGRFVVLAVLTYLINMAASISGGKSKNVHAAFVFTATLWLFITAFLGLGLVYNFTYNLMPYDSLHYLPLHAHAGVIGWFLLLVIGVGSRLIPMFLISKYTNVRLLWVIYFLINGALLTYLVVFYVYEEKGITLVPTILVLIAITLFIYYCRQAYKQRMRKQLDEQMKISLLSVFMLLLPVMLLFAIIGVLLNAQGEKINLVLSYGFLIFFGWLTAIILGMTFKTLPFIVWNKVYHHRSSAGKTPTPKDLFNHPAFNVMSVAYLLGFALFVSGILLGQQLVLKTGAGLLIITAVLYTWNVLKVINHQAA